MSSTVSVTEQKRSNPAEKPSAANDAMPANKKSFWQRHRLPVVLGVIAFLLYVGSILWMVFGSGQIVGS